MSAITPGNTPTSHEQCDYSNDISRPLLLRILLSVLTEAKVKGAEQRLEPYVREPMDILNSKLGKACPDLEFAVRDTLYEKNKTKELYEKWLVTMDHTVCGVGSENIPSWLPDRVPSQDLKSWDSYGLEVVIPVFDTTSDQGKEEIARVLDIIKGREGDNTGAFIPNQCGFQVHVQAPKDFRVIQELAKIHLIYEEEIARLNAHSRRPGRHPAAKDSSESNVFA
jgi:hypothetical protein